LCRTIDSKGATINFLLSALRDADAAKRLLRKALGDRMLIVHSIKNGVAYCDEQSLHSGGIE
jgi:hypothetical protein